MTHTEIATARLDRARVAFSEAQESHEKAISRLSAIHLARQSATFDLSEAALRKILSDEEVTKERVRLTEIGLEKAVSELKAAERGAGDAAAADVVVEMHTRGVQPILAIEREVQKLTAQIEQKRREQFAIFAREIEPRNAPWTQSNPFQAPPAGHYLGVADVVAQHFQ